MSITHGILSVYTIAWCARGVTTAAGADAASVRSAAASIARAVAGYRIDSYYLRTTAVLSPMHTLDMLGLESIN